ncbi:uncharacterized protein L201_005081 [Kwoniella dendrophila CBS 6074]|uniref:Adhesin domain-containing protein n=1 Tax=Kwoniella dendrophila CBS 6074 TaxID=1295534 RepID=A0AAX4K074_9TREE
MVLLPTYHPVPTGEEKSFNHHEQTNQAYQDISQVHPASIGNNISQYNGDEKVDFSKLHPASFGTTTPVIASRPTNTDKQRVTRTSKVKRTFLALILVYFVLVGLGKLGKLVAPGHGHKHHHQNKQFETGLRWRGHTFRHHGYVDDMQYIKPCNGMSEIKNEFSVIPTSYGSPILLEGEQKTANASFTIPFNRGKTLNINFEGVEGNVLISRDSALSGRHSTSEIIVESLFENDVNGVEMKSNDWVNDLTITAENMIDHRVHIILPAEKSRIPTLSISTNKSLQFEIDPSAQDVFFKSLKLKSENGDLDVSAIKASEINLETTTGAIGGTYNVSKALVLKTITGNIDAKVHVLEPWNGPHRRPPPPHHGEPPHKPGHHDDGDDDHKHKPKHHDGKEDDSSDDEEEHRHHKKDKRGQTHKREHKKKRHDHLHKKDKHPKKSWLSKLLGGSDEKHRHHHDHPHGPPPPEPAFIGAFSTTGSVNLTVLSQGSYRSSIIKAFSKTNNVSVEHAENFRGEYDVSTFVGEYTVEVPEKYKDHHIIAEGKSETGGFQKGLVGFKRPKGEHPPHRKQPPSKNETDVEEILEKRSTLDGNEEEASEYVQDDMENWFNILEAALEDDNKDFDFEHPPSPPPHKGPENHPHPPPPPPPGPSEPPHKGHREHPHPPSPPHRGPHEPHGPHGPHGPPHRPPPPPGHSRVFAHTDIGSVQVVL